LENIYEKASREWTLFFLCGTWPVHLPVVPVFFLSVFFTLPKIKIK
jgi:hypothetical protein